MKFAGSVTEAASIASEKLATTLLVVSTSFAPSVGTTLLTVGAVVSVGGCAAFSASTMSPLTVLAAAATSGLPFMMRFLRSPGLPRSAGSTDAASAAAPVTCGVAIEVPSFDFQVGGASGLLPRTVQYIHVTLHKALKQAVNDGLVPRNVTEAVKPPQLRREEITPLTSKQAKVLLKTVRRDRLEALYLLAITAGLRQGELLGLKWEDVDLERGTLQVRWTLSGLKNGNPI